MTSFSHDLEATRRAALLRSYAVLDTPPVAVLDDLTKLAAQICETPMALISLLDGERQWMKSRLGFSFQEVALESSICLHAVRETGIFVVEDATQDARFAANPLVCGEPGIRFYASSPLLGQDGVAIGTLCVLDVVPRTLRPEQGEALAALSRQVMVHLELNCQRRALSASTRKLSMIIDAVPCCVKLVARDGVLHEMNAAGLKIVGVDRLEQVLGMDLLRTVVPENQERMRAALAAAADGVESWQSFQIISIKGEKRWLEMYLAPFHDESRGENMVLAVSTDITERRASEAELRATAKRLSNAQRITKIGSWDLDLRTDQLRWSDQVFEIFREPKQAFAPSYEVFLRHVHPEDRARLNSLHQGAIRGEEVLDIEHRVVLPDGGEKLVHSRGELERDERGLAIRMSGTVQDITERKLLEQNVLRAQRMDSLGTLAGGIAHDLNNALAPILMSVELLEKKSPDPECQRLIAMINASAHRGADMVRQVLAFTRGAEGRRVEVPVDALLAEVESFVNDTFLKNIEVAVTFPPDLWRVMGDSTQLHQVLINLCLNARDAMPEGGVLRLSAENIEIGDALAALLSEAKPGAYVLIGVEDTGTGMPPSILEKIFDPFFTTKEVGKGTGLGLASVLSIVHGHGGFVRPHSELGKGTRFSVYLPARVDAPSAP